LAYDGQGKLYLTQDGRVRTVTRDGVLSTLSLPTADADRHPVTYFAGGSAFQGKVAGLANRVVYEVDAAGTLRALAGSPGVPGSTDGTGSAAGFGDIRDMARDGSGNLYVLEVIEHHETDEISPRIFENRVRKITPSGVVTTIYAPVYGGPQFQPYRIVADRAGNVFASAYAPAGSGTVVKIAAGGAVSAIPVSIADIPLIALDTAGNLYVAAAYTQPAIVEKVGPSGARQVVAGTAGSLGVIPGPLPGSLGPVSGLACDERSVCYVLSENALLSITP
jgi:hypothetical protein